MKSPAKADRAIAEKELRTRHATITVRRYRTERLRLEVCPRCGGTTEEVADKDLRCDCAEYDARILKLTGTDRPRQYEDGQPVDEKWWQK